VRPAAASGWNQVNNIILINYTWTANKISQAINRAHRLTNLRNVNIYVILCDRSADRVLEDNIKEKTNSIVTIRFFAPDSYDRKFMSDVCMIIVPLSRAAWYAVWVWLNCVKVVAMSALVALDICSSRLVVFWLATVLAASSVDCRTALPLICVTTWSSSVVRSAPTLDEMALVLPEVKSCWSAIK